MGSSLVLQGGAAVTKTLKEAVAQTAHGFTVGSVVRWDYANSKYITAIADSAANAEVAGVINQVDDADNFQITYHGYIEIPQLAGISAPVMFLSSVGGGSLAASPPSAVGTVVKPVLTKNTNGSGYLVMNYLGTQIGGSSTIAVDEIQPVGTIMPFAGTAIPDTWLACDGKTYAMSDYPELYSKLCYTTNARTPMYGYVVEINLSSGSSAIWTAIQVGDALITNSTSTTPTPTSYELIGRVLSKTASLGGLYPLTVQIFPNYSSTNKNFVYPDKIPLANGPLGAGGVKAYSTGNPNGTTDPYYGVAFGTDRGTGTINDVKLIAFNAPDLRGRVGVGIASSYLGEWESDALISSISGNYPPGSFGGEEKHTLTTAEMPSHKHKFVDWGGNQFAPSGTQYDLATVASGNYGYADTDTKPSYGNASDSGPSAVGENTPHNNMPPYLAVRYIIKAKPYTRAAIIDGIDLPYSSLLVRDLRSRNVGGSNGDLVFHTNTAGDSGYGTERVRVLGSGGTVVVGVTSSASNTLSANSAGLYITNSAKNSLGDLYVENSDANLSTGGGITLASFVCSALGSTQRRPRLHIKATDEGIILNESYNVDATNLMFAIGNVERMRLNATGLGVLTNSPGATLDVNGTLKVGDFGGSTNVMAKVNNTIAGGLPSVGCVLPMYASFQYATVLPAGTWFVFMTWNEGDSTTADEDIAFIMSKVWTVPTGQFLKFKNTATISSHTASGVFYKIGTDSTNDVTDTGWIEFKSQGTGKNAYDLTLTIGETTTNGENFGAITLTSNTTLANGSGYAIRIA